MKRFRKALLALAALLGVVIVGGIWLINSALNVASDVVDSTLVGAQKVQAATQREVVGIARNAQSGANVALAGAEHSLDAPDKPTPAKNAPTTLPANNTPDHPGDMVTSSAPQRSAKTNPAKTNSKNSPKDTAKNEEDSLADLGDLLNLFLNDGEDDSNLTALLKSDDKSAKGEESKDGQEAKGDKSGDKNAEDPLVDMIPGANSPTVKGWMAGKYKGKESQALDDALEDPKFLRLIFFLGGGM